MSDLVERLKEASGATTPSEPHDYGYYWNLCDKAADEIERLRAELEIEKQCYKDVQIECDNWFTAHEEEQIEHDKTRAERDALKKDAERYRWMRANSNKLNYCLLCGYDGLDCWEESDLDIQIDAAMEESK